MVLVPECFRCHSSSFHTLCEGALLIFFGGNETFEDSTFAKSDEINELPAGLGDIISSNFVKDSFHRYRQR